MPELVAAVVDFLWWRCFFFGIVLAEPVAVDFAAGLVVDLTAIGLFDGIGTDFSLALEVAGLVFAVGLFICIFCREFSLSGSFFDAGAAAVVEIVLAVDPPVVPDWANKPMAKNASPRVNATFFMMLKMIRLEKCDCLLFAQQRWGGNHGFESE